jgi:putative C-S lyase
MYDFTTILNRQNCGSDKWDLMKKRNSHVSDNIVPLSVADMEFYNPPEITEGLKNYLSDLVLGYPNVTDSCKNAVIGWMQKRHNWDIHPDWIENSAGVVSALYNAVRSFTEPGEGVIVFSPVYPPFYKSIETNNRILVQSDLLIDNGKYVIDFDDFEKKAKDANNKLLLFCSPHNPVGRVWTKQELERVADICLKNNIIVVSDEIHSDLIMPGYKHIVFSTLNDDVADNSVICTAPSKTFNIAGMQTSNIIIKNENLRKQFKAGMAASAFHSLNILGYKACEIAYTQCEKWLEELIIVINKNKIFVETFMKERIPQIAVFNMEGTYLQWWDCKSLKMDHLALEEFMTKKAFLFFTEGYAFGDSGKGFERINLACPQSTLEAALLRLEQAVSAL